MATKANAVIIKIDSVLQPYKRLDVHMMKRKSLSYAHLNHSAEIFARGKRIAVSTMITPATTLAIWKTRPPQSSSRGWELKGAWMCSIMTESCGRAARTNRICP